MLIGVNWASGLQTASKSLVHKCKQCPQERFIVNNAGQSTGNTSSLRHLGQVQLITSTPEQHAERNAWNKSTGLSSWWQSQRPTCLAYSLVQKASSTEPFYPSFSAITVMTIASLSSPRSTSAPVSQPCSAKLYQTPELGFPTSNYTDAPLFSACEPVCLMYALPASESTSWLVSRSISSQSSTQMLATLVASPSCSCTIYSSRWPINYFSWPSPRIMNISLCPLVLSGLIRYTRLKIWLCTSTQFRSSTRQHSCQSPPCSTVLPGLIWSGSICLPYWSSDWPPCQCVHSAHGRQSNPQLHSIQRTPFAPFFPRLVEQLPFLLVHLISSVVRPVALSIEAIVRQCSV